MNISNEVSSSSLKKMREISAHKSIGNIFVGRGRLGFALTLRKLRYFKMCKLLRKPNRPVRLYPAIHGNLNQTISRSSLTLNTLDGITLKFASLISCSRTYHKMQNIFIHLFRPGIFCLDSYSWFLTVLIEWSLKNFLV